MSAKQPQFNRYLGSKLHKVPENEEVVIAGISGRYPECESIDEFMRKLYNKEDLVTEDDTRQRKDLPLDAPIGMGKLKQLDKFDSKFFGCDDIQTNDIDAQLRILLETTWEAIWDAGIDPQSLSGTNTGLFIGNCFEELLNAHSSVGTVPLYKHFLASQVAYRFNFKGPAMAADTACASSFTALTEALWYMRHNVIDKAIVAGVNLGLNPMVQFQFFRLNMLSPDGKCKCLDESANGYAKGEAVVAILLQKRPDAKRIYATLIHTKTNNDGYEEMGITYPTWESQRDLMVAAYQEAGVNPHDVGYCEAHCTGTQAGDPEEMRAICHALCSDGRKTPLLIGAHKSNIGHTEASSGLCALSKVIISFENELIPSNIHFKKGNPKVEGIWTGQLKPVNDNTPFTGQYVGMNNFGFGGSNIHVIVKAPKIQAKADNKKVVGNMPRLVNMCGRNEEAIKHFFECLFEAPEKITRDLLALINDISKSSPVKGDNEAYVGMNYRGFAIIDSLDNVKEISNFNAKEIKEKDREVWFVMSGMGTQWTAMANDLLKFDICQQSIKTLSDFMKKYSIDLMDLLTNPKQNISESVLKSFLTIAAVQITLIDLLEELGVKPDGIIGHSIGELVCAYADKCLTKEETIAIAYWRAKCIEASPTTRGSMAAIGMGAKEAKGYCPSNVFIACNNADDSVTVAGEDQPIRDFVEYLKSKNLFAANVDSSGIAFHSPLMYSVGEEMTTKLKNVMPNTRTMTSRWISSNYSHQSKTISAHYFVDNLLYPIRFNESLKKIPKNAVVIEISPHCLLQSIIKRGLGPDISYVPMMRKNDDNLNLLLSSIGTLYTLGLNPNIEKLYPKVEYPVSNGTKFISPMVKWIHDKSFVVTKYPEFFMYSQNSKTKRAKCNLLDKEDQYVTGHVIDGRNLYPGTGYLVLIWKHLASFHNLEYEEMAVEFTDVIFHRASIVQQTRELKFATTLDPITGEFILTESDALVVTGNVKRLTTGLEFQYYLEENSYKIRKTDSITISKQDVYTTLRLRGYDYKTSFRSISEAYVEDRKVKSLIEWSNNWVVFSDNMIQISILGVDSKGLFIPVRLELIRFDPKLLLAEALAKGDNPKLEAFFDYDTKIGVCKGMEYRAMKANLVQRNFITPSLMLGDYGYKPYEELIASDNEDQLIQYNNRCDELANKLLKKLEMIRSVGNVAKIISKTSDIEVESNAKNRHLLKFLADIERLNQYEPEVVKELESFKDLDDDILISTIENKWLIDTQMMTVYDNKRGLELKTLEVADSYRSAQPLVTQCYDPHEYNIKLNYTLLKRMAYKMEGDEHAIDWPLKDSTVPSDLKEFELIIYKNDAKEDIDLNELMKSIWDKLRTNGFFQIIFREKFSQSEKLIRDLLHQKSHTMDRNQIIKEAENCGFTYIGWNGNRFGAHSLLFRKTAEPQLEKQIFFEINNDFSQWIEKLKDEIRGIHEKPEGENIWLIGKKSAKNGILGLVYTLRKELNGIRIRSIFNFNGKKEDLYGNPEVLKNILKKDLVYNIYRDGHWGCFKPNITHSLTKPVMTEHCFLNTSNRGDLSSLKWFECQHKLWPIGRKEGELLCYIYFAPLNFRDIMLASGRLPADALPGDIALSDCQLGLEFSGRDENGNRVMGMIPAKALASTCVVDDPDFLWPIPEHWSMEEASTVPCVYSTAYYSLIIRGNLKRGEKVLIHSGSGGVGQAAINICLDLGCQVFVTVGSTEKREFLKKLFPSLTDRNFSSSRDLSFRPHVMQETNGLGVDVVLNSLSDDKLQASLQCLANNGRFLEIGKYDMSINAKLDMAQMVRNKSFHGILLDALFSHDESTPPMIRNARKRIWELMKDGIKRGVVKPLNRSIFHINETEEAFRFMSSGKHMGKVIIKVRDEEPVGQTVQLKGFEVPAVPRTVFNPNEVYIITGGLGGFGMEMIDWMIDRDAKKFLVTSRTGATSGYQKMKLRRFRDIGGADVHIVTDLDLSSPKEATTLLSIASRIGPIGGIFHLALDLQDGIFENQSEDTFKRICKSKSDAFIILDIVCRKFCPDLRYFVGFSSGVASRGNVGQASYGYSNSVIDMVCEMRKQDGYNGLAIEWGAIGDVGIAVKSGNEEAIIVGTVAQRIPFCMQLLDQILQSVKPVALVFTKCEVKNDAGLGKDNFLKKLAHILGMDDIKKLDTSTKFLKLGMDSLMAVEVQLSLEREFGAVLTAQEVRDLSIAKVIEIAEQADK